MLSLCFYKCSSIKNIPQHKSLLVNESFVLNGVPLNQELSKQLSLYPPNSYILGVPAKLHLFNLAKKNSDSLFDVWLDKKDNRREKLTRVYSEL